MKLERIITLANRKVELRFAAMERSLRAVGCKLPLWVIPYNDDLFKLPVGATWWKNDSLCTFFQEKGANPGLRKCQCLLESNYQFVDADVIFLRNPESALEGLTNFVTSCGHWHNPGHTFTNESLAIFKAGSTTWQRNRFNSGQFACDRSLFSQETLIELLTRYAETCLSFHNYDQPGLNLLVELAGIPVTNLTLPPHCMESTWAGDYDGEFLSYWKNGREPYLIHWAGVAMEKGRPIHELFYRFLTGDERRKWAASVAAGSAPQVGCLRNLAWRLRAAWRAITVQ